MWTTKSHVEREEHHYEREQNYYSVSQSLSFSDLRINKLYPVAPWVSQPTEKKPSSIMAINTRTNRSQTETIRRPPSELQAKISLFTARFSAFKNRLQSTYFHCCCILLVCKKTQGSELCWLLECKWIFFCECTSYLIYSSKFTNKNWMSYVDHLNPNFPV